MEEGTKDRSSRIPGTIIGSVFTCNFKKHDFFKSVCNF